MKSPNWKSVDICAKNGYKITLDFIEEDQSPQDQFLIECEWTKEEYQEISAYYWFVAGFTAKKEGYEDGHSYLGGNCYKSKKEVLGDSIDTLLGGYGAQLIEEAIEACEISTEKPDFNPIY